MKPTHSHFGALLAVTGSALVVFFLVGCSGSSKEAVSEKTVTSSSQSSSAGNTGKADGGMSASQAAAQLAHGVPAPTLVEETTETLQYPDKKPKIVRGVKRYSDNQLVNHGHYVNYYQNGQKFEEGQYTDNQKQGTWHVWHENGKEAKVENYVNGQPDGRFVLNNDQGLPEREASYKAGRRDGVWKYYYPDGKQVSQQEEYRDDKLDGAVYKWFPDGAKSGEYHFQSGQRLGLQRDWFKSGKVAAEAEYVGGKLIRLTTFNEDGTKKQEQEFADGKATAKPQAKGS
jgi:antitoxin component YwqK of YwqJK toxin-antitoxin module